MVFQRNCPFRENLGDTHALQRVPRTGGQLHRESFQFRRYCDERHRYADRAPGSPDHHLTACFKNRDSWELHHILSQQHRHGPIELPVVFQRRNDFRRKLRDTHFVQRLSSRRRRIHRKNHQRNRRHHEHRRYVDRATTARHHCTARCANGNRR